MIPNSGPEWVVQMRSGAMCEEARRQMRQWMDEAPEHARDLLRAETAWRLSGGLENEEFLREELAELDAMPVSNRLRAWRRPVLATAATLAVATAGALFWSSRPLVFSTPVGDQRVVALPDGSSMVLNTQTLVEVKFTSKGRDIHLRRGEALFQVARDATRAFVVHTTAGSARAVGTRFNVLADDSGAVTVSVLEGRVAVTPLAAPAHARDTLLSAGESVSCTRDGKLAAPAAEQASVQRITAWREGKLRFDGWPLQRAVSEYNRYADKPIVLDTFVGNDVLVSGVFRIGDAENFLDALVELVDGKIVEEKDALRLHAKDSGKGG